MDSYHKFYTQYKDRLFSYLLFKCGDGDVAQDVMQESFVRHYQRYGNSTSNSPSLLYTIAKNRLIDHLRGNWRSQRGVPDLLKDKSVKSEEANLITRENVTKLIGAIKKLPETDQEILVLATMGTCYREIAETTDISVSNVKVRIHRARRKLLELLDEEEA